MTIRSNLPQSILSTFNEPPVGGTPPQQPAPTVQVQAPVASPYGAQPQHAPVVVDVASLLRSQPAQPQQTPAPQMQQPQGESEIAVLRRELAARDAAQLAIIAEANARILAHAIEAEVQRIVAHYGGEIDIASLNRSSMDALRASVPTALQKFKDTELFFFNRFAQRAHTQNTNAAQGLVEALAPYPQGVGMPMAPNAPSPVANPAPTPQQQGFVHPQMSHEAAAGYAQFRQELVQGRVMQPVPPGFVPPAGQFFQPSYPQAPSPYAPPAPVSHPQGYPTMPAQPGYYQPHQQPQQPQPQPPQFYPNQQPQQPQFAPGMPPGSPPNVAPLPDPSMPPNAHGRQLSSAEAEAAQEHARAVAQNARINPHRMAGLTNGKPVTAEAIGGGAPGRVHQGPGVASPSQHPMYRN